MGLGVRGRLKIGPGGYYLPRYPTDVRDGDGIDPSTLETSHRGNRGDETVGFGLGVFVNSHGPLGVLWMYGSLVGDGDVIMSGEETFILLGHLREGGGTKGGRNG